MPTNYATKQAASKLQVSPNTLRNWSEQYADSLSESARPGHQPERQFTDMDMTVLQYIKQLRGEGMKEDGIKQRLSETTFTDTEILQPATNILQQDQSTAIQNAQDAPDSTAALIMALDIIETLQHRIEAIEESKHNATNEVVMSMARRLEAVEESQQAPDELTVDMTRRLEAVEQIKVNDRRLVRDGVFMFMAGAIVMGVVILLFVAIVWLYGR